MSDQSTIDRAIAYLELKGYTVEAPRESFRIGDRVILTGVGWGLTTDHGYPSEATITGRDNEGSFFSDEYGDWYVSPDPDSNWSGILAPAATKETEPLIP